jgi:hypothetical protein
MAGHNDAPAANAAAAKMRFAARALGALTLSLALLAPAGTAVRASDHADPMNLQDPEANITDLFFYPKGDQMILIFCVRRALTKPKPFNLAPYEYVLHMDLTTPVTFDKDDDRARYGGTIATPERLHSDVTLRFRLNDDATLKSKSFQGLKVPDEQVRIYTGVREDPFNFPRFFKKNTIGMVLSIPMAAFPPGQRDWILWGTSHKDGTQIDHVGRSNRTQQARFDALNTLEPKDHVNKIMELMTTWDDRVKRLKSFKEYQTKAIADFLQLLLQIRKYDLQPDVMIYTSRFAPKFPNGRQLLDDVAALTCAAGDCILQELSFIEGGWPRALVNDKPFLDDWPYLAEPYPDAPEPAPPTDSIWPYLIGIVLLFALVSWAVIQLIIWLIRWAFWGWRRKTAVPA